MIPRQRELWVTKAFLLPEWTYAESLTWIAFRDEQRFAQHLNYGDSPVYGDDPTVIDATLILKAKSDPTMAEAAPAAALEVSLLRGDVIGLADYTDGSNRRNPVKIRRADWQHLSVRNDPRRGARTRGLVLVDKREYTSSPHYVAYVDFRLDRESLLKAFPAPANEDIAQAPITEAVVPVGQSLPDPSVAWLPRPGELQKSWARRADVVEEAQRRIAQRLTQKKAINGALGEMAKEAKTTWTQASIAASRRRNPG